jgi:hypothetical protein
MAGKIIADTIESAGSQISLNVGNVTILTASSTGTGLTTANITTANITTVNVTGVATFSAGSVGTPSITASGDTNTGLYFPAADTIAFTTAGTEDMRITSAGLLGVNANSFPYTEQLRVNFPNTQGLHLNETTNSSSVNYIYLTKGSGPTNVGAAFYNGSSIAWQTTSDYRLKENIVPLTNALDVVKNLKPKSYRWKESQQNDTGFIAHELQALFPQAVSGQKDEVDERGNPRYQGVDVSFLVATLTAAIQELKVIVDAQAVEIAALKAK